MLCSLPVEEAVKLFVVSDSFQFVNAVRNLDYIVIGIPNDILRDMIVLDTKNVAFFKGRNL